MNNFAHVVLKAKEETEIQQGFPWVYDNEIQGVKWTGEDGSGAKSEGLENCPCEDGSVVEVYTNKGGFLGSGVLNKKSNVSDEAVDAQ